MLTLLAGQAGAQQLNPFETHDQARQRNSAENWNTYQRNNGNAPLGGYNSGLSSGSRDSERPGYNSRQDWNSGSSTGSGRNSSGSDSWRR